ncbi:MAG: mercury(II) reductase [Nitrosarchaeum sp.]|nr:MAG: mercury(II) reductase [Nitrosarchaeum sp.]
METNYDLVILGGGAAAFSCALKAAEMDVKIAMIEKGVIGGTCVNVGCVPTKNLLDVGEKIHECADLSGNGKLIDFKKIIESKNDIVLSQRNAKYIDVLDSLPNVEYIKGHAKFKSNNEIEINGNIISAKHVLIATGSSSMVPPIQGINNVDYLTNIDALDLDAKPESMIIIGGRVLGLEFAQMFSRFGTKVTVLQRNKRLIPNEEPEISDKLRQYLEEEGITIHTGVEIKSVRKQGNETMVLFSIDGNEQEASAEKILLATGRTANTKDLGLENTEVRLSSDGSVIVDEQMRTNVSHVYAAGDVIGEPMLETVAAKEGNIVASNAFFETHKKMDFGVVPHAIFTSPQVASVGITERESMEKFASCSCKTLLMEDVPKALVVGKTKGLIKMIVHPQTQQILGVHILSDLAADIIHEATLAVKQKLTIDDIIDTVHVFPTMSESIKLVATSFRKDVKKMSCCVE